MKKSFVQFFIVFLMGLTIAGCQDVLMTIENIGDGKASVSATLDFRPMSSALDRTRAAGNALKDIYSLHVLLYDYENKTLIKSWMIKDYSVSDESRGDDDADNGHSAETTTKHASFKLPEEIDFGRYYMYAVANIPDLLDKYSEAIKTVDGLKNISLVWNTESVTANGQMMGCFMKSSASDLSVGDDALIVNEKSVKLHSWLRRAASKVTIAYDGTNLKEGVSIYIMAVSIKDIPRVCPLGTMNTPDHRDSLIHDGETIKYFEGDVTPGLPNFVDDYKAVVSKQNPIYGSDHSETADALFFYENMQGEGKDKKQTAPGPGNDNGNEHGIGYPNPDENVEGTGWKDDKPYGTYIEVDAVYRSENAERPGVGTIKYRFMLGKNITTDYNAERNHHYKLTLKFNNFANDYDWHIEYKEQVLEVTNNRVMNYQGKVFIPEYRPGTLNYNYGHNFADNTVAVTSYIEDSERVMVEWKMEFDEDGDGKYTDKCSWIEPVITDGDLPYIKNVSFKVTPQKQDIDIDSLLRSAKMKGTEAAPYNLANPGQTAAPEDARIKCTANCYIVDAPGYYILPLVYGNAFHNFQPNENSYKYAGSYTGSQILATFKDYLGREIKSPYIKGTAPEYTPKSAFLLWQDEDTLVQYTVWNPTADIKYLPEAYGGKGGIMFRVERSYIKQGNAVIGVSNEMKESGNTTIPPVMWSWHIWVTDFSYLEENDKNIEVTGHDNSQKFNFMPVNLGWCSGHGDKIKYYKARKCKVKFTAGEKETVIELEQKSHIAFTRGNNIYYQWGRKDPFVGATANNTNKRRYFSVNWHDDANPQMLFPDNTPNDARYTTRQAVDDGALIRNPHLWHNPRRIKNPASETDDNVYPFLSDNEIYRNLWQGRIEISHNSPTLKTVYDPCPVGYQVPHVNAISGFTTTGDNTNTPFEWYDVRVENIAGYDAETGTCGVYSMGLYEFYTNPEKLQSIIFPETGYRDWDDYANAYQVNIESPIGYIWTAGNKNGDDNNSYNFEFSRKDWSGNSYIRPKNYFYPCDGMPVRPCVYDNHSAATR